MYSDLIDRARKPDSGAQMHMLAESCLFFMILNGKHPTLILPQTFDSDLILSMMKSRRKDAFLSALREGFIKISPYKECYSIQEYLIKVLTLNIENNPKSFYFSCFPFLYTGKYGETQQRKIFSALREQLAYGKAKISCGLLSSEEKQYINEYTDIIFHLNLASRSSFLPCCLRPVPLSRRLRENTQERIKALETMDDHSAINCELLDFYQHLLKFTDWNSRTNYYNYLSLIKTDYSKQVLEEARELIDLSYHETIASSICDGEPDSCHISGALPSLAAAAVFSSRTIGAANTAILKGSPEENSLSWPDLLEIARQVREIAETKTCSWEEALQIYTARQQRLPYVLHGKYGIITGLTCALSSIPGLDVVISHMVSKLIWSAAADLFGETMKKPSFKEILTCTTQAREKSKLMKAFASATSVLKSGEDLSTGGFAPSLAGACKPAK